ncbi:hypothetical protein K1719_007546 [Acacia pycnantha]|nr:hypothetical protein K1719_007546 [Acacia pycnantha]
MLLAMLGVVSFKKLMIVCYTRFLKLLMKMKEPYSLVKHIFKDDALASNRSKVSHSFDGMADAEVERRLKDTISAAPPSNIDLRLI